MRPDESKITSGVIVEMYECFECGRRAEDVDRRICRSCGGELQYIGKARDQ